jgi:hypothetical protein
VQYIRFLLLNIAHLLCAFWNINRYVFFVTQFPQFVSFLSLKYHKIDITLATEDFNMLRIQTYDIKISINYFDFDVSSISSQMRFFVWSMFDINKSCSLFLQLPHKLHKQLIDIYFFSCQDIEYWFTIIY